MTDKTKIPAPWPCLWFDPETRQHSSMAPSRPTYIALYELAAAETYAAALAEKARQDERERLMKVLIYADVRAQGCKKRADDCGSLARTLLEALDAIRAG